METFAEELKAFWGFVMEMLGEMLGGIPRLINFFLWVIAGVFILPCVFISGVIYPLWEKWSEDF